jgi:hypothetical protein
MESALPVLACLVVAMVSLTILARMVAYRAQIWDSGTRPKLWSAPKLPIRAVNAALSSVRIGYRAVS